MRATRGSFKGANGLVYFTRGWVYYSGTEDLILISLSVLKWSWNNKPIVGFYSFMFKILFSLYDFVIHGCTNQIDPNM